MNRVNNRRNGLPSPNHIDRLPPFDMSAEQGLLGSILLDARTALQEVQDKIGTDSFYDLRHQQIYDLLSSMHESGERIDLITVQSELKKRNQLEAVGGLTYLSALMDTTPSAHMAESYAEIIHEKYLLRRMVQICTESVSRIYDNEGTAGALLDSTQTALLKLGHERIDGEAKAIKTLVHNAIDQIEQLHRRQGQTSGLETGFVDLDKLTGGLHPGDVTVLAGRPSTGKTSLAMNIVEHVGIDLAFPVGVFSLEMTAESLVLRMLCSRARVNQRMMREGFLSERDFPKLIGAAGKISNSKVFIDDQPALTLMRLRAKARKMFHQHGIKLAVLDYLQLMTADRRTDSPQQDLTIISGGIKALAKELGIPIILLSQLNRTSDKEDRPPRVSDLRGSGSIEQDADTILLLYKPKVRDEEENENENMDVCTERLIIGKQRNGPTGHIDLTFLKGFTRFESCARVTEEDQPRFPDP